MKPNTAFATLLLFPLACAIAADEAATAPVKSRPDPAQTFKQFDRNGDGGVSLEEYKVGMAGQMAPARIPEVFKKKDADGDGKLTLPELMYVPPQAPATPPADKGAKKKK